MLTSTTNYAGHHPKHVGLQNHSVGSAYPLAIVAYDSGSGVVYTVQNLTSGRTAGFNNERVRQFSTAAYATQYLDALVNGIDHVDVGAYQVPLGETTWLMGRPEFDDMNQLYIPIPF